MTDYRAPEKLVPLPLRRTGLAYHFPDGVLGTGEIVRRTGKVGGQSTVRVLEIGQVDVNFPLQLPERFHPLVAAAVAHHRHREFGLQGRQDGGKKVGGGDEIDILRPLGDQVFENSAQSGGIHGSAHGAAADGGVLAVFAAQGAAAEEQGAAAPGAGQNRLLPHMAHGFGHQGGSRAAAEAGFAGGSVDAAFSGAQAAVGVVHENTSL